MVATLAWGVAMDRLTDAAQPLGDAAIAVASVVAQLLMARRKLENWLLWIAVDVASIPLFAGAGAADRRRAVRGLSGAGGLGPDRLAPRARRADRRA